MKTFQIIHLGIGRVGKKVMELIYQNQPKFKKEYGVNLKYVAIFNSHGGYYQKNGITLSDISNIKDNISQEEIIHKTQTPFIVIDTTASEKTYPCLENALKKGAYVVLSNKKPLSSSQKFFDKLHLLGKKRLFYETTVGAGLPVIFTLKNLLSTNDTIYGIEGCFSGTLGFITSSLEKGVSYSQSIKKAIELGLSEPDPRDDLTGTDVARKALILSRLLGIKLELSDIQRMPFYDKSLEKLTIPDFLKATKKNDKKYQKLFAEASKQNMTYRYTALIHDGKIKIGLKKVPKSSPIGNLNGPDNIIVFRTKYYYHNPLVIRGPGAGVEVTATGVIGDILQIINSKI